MLKQVLLILIAVSYMSFMTACNEAKSQEEHNHTEQPHEHGENCDHSHTEEEAHEGHNHAADEHQHGEDCDHSHEETDNHEGHDHSHEGHDHAADEHQHGEDCDHSHEETDSHEGHDHSHEGHDHGSSEDSHEGHDHGAENPNEVEFSAEMAAQVGLETTKVKHTEFYEVIKTSGEILPARGDESIVVASHSGKVFFSGDLLFEGTDIRKNQQLFVISSESLVDDNYKKEFLEAKAAFMKQKSDFERASKLFEDKIIPEKEFLSIKLDFENAELTFNHISSNYASDGLKIKSPISGYVSKVFVEAGQYVEIGQPLMKVSKNKKLVMRADLPQRYYAQILNITSASFKTTYCQTPHDLKDLNGRLISYGKYTDGSSYYTPIFFELDSRSHIIPGAYVEVYLHSTPIEHALVVPKEAIMEEQGLYYVFVKLSATHYERRFVEVAGNDGLRVRITSGINEGDIVVGKGANNIKLASKASGSVPHSHSH